MLSGRAPPVASAPAGTASSAGEPPPAAEAIPTVATAPIAQRTTHSAAERARVVGQPTQFLIRFLPPLRSESRPDPRPAQPGVALAGFHTYGCRSVRDFEPGVKCVSRVRRPT